MEHEKHHAHMSHEDIVEKNGRSRRWWHLDFRSFQGAVAIAGAIVIIASAAWGMFAVVTVSVFDPHIRRIVREEVPAAMQTLIDTAVVRAAIPHMETAVLQHKHLQEQIDDTNKLVTYNRDEREKMLKELIANDQIQRQEISAMRADIVRLTANVQTLYELLLKMQPDGKQERKSGWAPPAEEK
jgi:uncharacterized membrane protein